MTIPSTNSRRRDVIALGFAGVLVIANILALRAISARVEGVETAVQSAQRQPSEPVLRNYVAALPAAQREKCAPSVAVDQPRPDEPAAEASTPESSELVRARTETWAVIDRAIAAKRWTQQDQLALRQLISKLPAVERQETIAALFDAVNRGVVKPDSIDVLEV